MDCANGFWCFQLKDLINSLVLMATIAAIIRGPVVAVRLTQANEQERERSRRQFQIFHSLMKTRRFALDPEHVATLNVIQVEFHRNDRILRAYRSYMDNLSLPLPLEDDHRRIFLDSREDLLFDLIHEIGSILGYGIDKRDLQKLSYAPQGWNNDEMELRRFRRLMIELLEGKGAISVRPALPAQAQGKFPPPPTS